MQYAKYFANKMKISQSYNEGNHKDHTTGEYKDYPIDETYGDSGRTGYFLAPFDCKVVKKWAANSNQIWLTSTDKVKTPIGEDVVTIFLCHISNDEYNAINVGDTYKQGDKVVMEYKDSKSTGNHNHVSAGLGEMSGTGWKQSNGVWVLQTKNGTRKPEEIFYIDKFITKIVDNAGIDFVDMPAEEETEYKTGIYKVLENLYIRKTAGTDEHVLVKDCTDKMKNALTSTNSNDKAVVKAGHNITALEIIEKDNGSVWVKNYNGYLCLKGVSGQVYLEFVE